MMLKKFLKIAVALPLATILIVASSGLTIFLHHCDCEGKTEISIYSEVGCDMHTTNNVQHGCCDFEEVEAISNESESCGCNNEQVSIKLNDVVPVVSTSISFIKILVAVVEQNVHTEKLITPENSQKFYTESDTPPPTLWGKALLISLNSLKISDTLS